MASKTVQFPSEVAPKAKASFIADFKSELKKVTWTPKQELVKCAKVVLISMFTFGLGIYAVDLTIRSVLTQLSNLVQLIAR